MKRISLAFLLIVLSLTAYGQCFTMVAGRKVSKSGRVLLAHNEDDATDQPTKTSYVPAADGSLGYYWIEIAGLDVADSFLNDRNVCVVSNRCRSKEKNMDEGGLLYEIRLTVAQKARSAREAVEMVGAMVEKDGYRHNGRSYTIADPLEAWVISFIGGKHWMAQRIPDDKVFILPNNFVLRSIDLSDRANFLSSSGLIEYAESRGWSDVAEGRGFSFKDAFGDEKTYYKDRNVLRHKKAIEYFTGRKYGSDPNGFELFVTPKKKVSPSDMISLLREAPICVRTTRYSVVFELDTLSPVTWLCYVRPDLGTFFRMEK